MTIPELEKKIKAIDPRLEIIPNPNRTDKYQKCGQGLSNIKLAGVDICPVPSSEIRDKHDPHYYYVFPNGMIAPHNSVEDVICRIEKTLEFVKTEKGKDIFFSKDE